MKLTKENERIISFVKRKQLSRYLFPFINNDVSSETLSKIVKIRQLIEKLLTKINL